MKKTPSVVFDTITVERTFLASRATVFAAFADGEQRRRWHVPGDHWVVTEMTHDFRVGGIERFRFGPRDAPHLLSAGYFLHIVPDERIVSAGTMHEDDRPISSTLCTVEFARDGAGTALKLTDQSAFYDERETPEERRGGWGKVLERLEAHLAHRSGIG